MYKRREYQVMTLANSSIPQDYTLDIEPEGCLTFPKEIQQILNWEDGDRLILTLEDNGKLELVSLKQQVKKLRVLLNNKSPDRNSVDKLIEERRHEYLSE